MVFAPTERGHVFSFDEYVEIADRSPNRVELWEGFILDMTGGTPRHSAICSNIGGILRNQLRGKPCRVFDANLRVRSLLANRTTYADVTVVCGDLELDPADRTRQTVLNPTVLIEGLSKSTASDDRGPKLDVYKTIASVQAVVLVAQNEPLVIVHERRADGSWAQASHAAGVVALPAIACSLPLAEVYEELPDG
jgi:Uma2 family endonuclease